MNTLRRRLFLVVLFLSSSASISALAQTAPRLDYTIGITDAAKSSSPSTSPEPKNRITTPRSVTRGCGWRMAKLLVPKT